MNIQERLSSVNNANCGAAQQRRLYPMRMETLGKRVARAREERQPKMSQEDLAKAAGLSQQAVQQLETGKVQRPRFLVEIAEALGVELQWLRTGKGEMWRRSVHTEQPVRHPDRGALNGSLGKMNDPGDVEERTMSPEISQRMQKLSRPSMKDQVWVFDLIDRLYEAAGVQEEPARRPPQKAGA